MEQDPPPREGSIFQAFDERRNRLPRRAAHLTERFSGQLPVLAGLELLDQYGQKQIGTVVDLPQRTSGQNPTTTILRAE